MSNTLEAGEIHPMAVNAFHYVRNYPNLPFVLGAMSSCAIEGNKIAEICAETLRRILDNEPFSDRYLLGLAWFLKEMEENNE